VHEILEADPNALSLRSRSITKSGYLNASKNPCEAARNATSRKWETPLLFFSFALFIGSAYYWFFFRSMPFCDNAVAIGCNVVGNCRACPF